MWCVPDYCLTFQRKHDCQETNTDLRQQITPAWGLGGGEKVYITCPCEGETVDTPQYCSGALAGRLATKQRVCCLTGGKPGTQGLECGEIVSSHMQDF